MAKRKRSSEGSAQVPEGIIISSWKGIPYIRSKPLKVANPRTPDQVHQRNKMTPSMDFLRANILMVRSGFRFYKTKRSAFNAALSYTLLHGFPGEGLEIDHSKVLLSRGELEKPLEGKFLAGEHEVVVTWDGQNFSGNAKASDRAMIAVYDPENQESLVVLRGCRRSDGAQGQKIALPDTFNRTSWKVYLAFNAADESLVSDSVLCEEITDLPVS